jgi:hypothetical protein
MSRRIDRCKPGRRRSVAPMRRTTDTRIGAGAGGQAKGGGPGHLTEGFGADAVPLRREVDRRPRECDGRVDRAGAPRPRRTFPGRVAVLTAATAAALAIGAAVVFRSTDTFDSSAGRPGAVATARPQFGVGHAAVKPRIGPARVVSRPHRQVHTPRHQDTSGRHHRDPTEGHGQLSDADTEEPADAEVTTEAPAPSEPAAAPEPAAPPPPTSIPESESSPSPAAAAERQFGFQR